MIKVYTDTQIIILESAKKLFWKFGIKKVTIEEIARTAGVSKMTIYRSFKNKQEIAEILITKLYDEGFERFQNIMNQKKSFESKIIEIIKMESENTQDMSETLLSDLLKNNKGLHDLVEKFQQNSIQLVVDYFIIAQKNNELREEISPELIKYLMNNLLVKLSDKDYIHLFKTPQQAVVESVKLLFYGISIH